MFGLLIRLTILGAVVFGVVRGITGVLRARSRRRAELEIRRELRALSAGCAEGLFDAAEQDQLTRAIHDRCREAGIDVRGLGCPSGGRR